MGRPPTLRIHRQAVAALAVLAALLLTAGPARSQTSVDAIEVVALDAASFPVVTVYARILGPDGLPVPDLGGGVLTLTEDGIRQEYEHHPTDAGVQMAIVADIGAGSEARGATGEPRYVEVRTLVEQTIESMGPNDTATLILHNGSVSVLQEMTGDRAALRAAAAQITENTTELTNGPAAVVEALVALNATSEPARSPTVVVISTGVQQAATSDYDNIREQAAALAIPVYAILANSNPDTGTGWERVAADTGGLYAHYTSAETSALPIFTALEGRRSQYTFTYRSASGTSAQRSISLEALGASPPIPRDSTTFTVDLRDPQVVFEQPLPGSEFVRSAERYNQNLDTVEPTSATITAHIEWPDSYPRAISSAQLYINGSQYGGPVLAPGDSFTFAWDLRQYRTPGDNLVQIQVEVIDELGRVSISEPVLVTVVVNIPPEPEQPVNGDERGPACTLSDGLLNFAVCVLTTRAGLIALILAIPTLILALIVWRNRSQIVQIAGTAGESITGFVARVTRPADESRSAAAFLTVLRGDAYLIGKTFPIYAGTVTPIGRDKSQVEIVFPDEENSVISRKHCEIRQEDGGFKLRDFASTYGTFLNGARLPELGVETLHHGDEIALGPVERGGVLLRFEIMMTDENLPDGIRDTQPA
jgi:hypothetical protein